MRSAILLGILSLSFAVLAKPAVGDYSQHQVSYDGENIFTKRKEIVSYNPGTKEFESEWSTILNEDGSLVNGFKFSEDSAFISKNRIQIRQQLAECGSSSTNGNIEVLITPAGRMKTCRYEYDNKSKVLWYGDVPNGVVKEYRLQDGQERIEILEKFSWQD